jgi:4-carboxymuconolactone decarboxylase
MGDASPLPAQRSHAPLRLETRAKGCQKSLRGHIEGVRRGNAEKNMDRELWEKGLKARKATLGAEYVEKSLSTADEFNADFQDMLNEFCWGKIWGDSTIPPKTRSMMNLTMLASLGRMHEWELHLNGALNNGVTKDELKAILHQIAIYAGFPAGVECFRIARKVLAERAGK